VYLDAECRNPQCYLWLELFRDGSPQAFVPSFFRPNNTISYLSNCGWGLERYEVDSRPYLPLACLPPSRQTRDGWMCKLRCTSSDNSMGGIGKAKVLGGKAVIYHTALNGNTVPSGIPFFRRAWPNTCLDISPPNPRPHHGDLLPGLRASQRPIKFSAAY